MATDYYELLGVPRSADDKAIKAAYRKLAMDCHPDRHGGCTDKEAHFKSISEAYDVLKDPQKRAAYDRFGHAAFQNGDERAGPFGGGAGGGFEGFSDIFSSIFGEFMDPRAQRASAARGSDLRYDLELTLEEAFSGVEKTIADPGAGELRGMQRVGLARASRRRAPAQAAAAPARSARSRAFSSSSGPVPAAWVRAKPSPIPATACEGEGRALKIAQAQRQHPGRSRRRHAHPRRRRGRGRRARRGGRATSTCSST